MYHKGPILSRVSVWVYMCECVQRVSIHFGENRIVHTHTFICIYNLLCDIRRMAIVIVSRPLTTLYIHTHVYSYHLTGPDEHNVTRFRFRLNSPNSQRPIYDGTGDGGVKRTYLQHVCVHLRACIHYELIGSSAR